MGKRGSKKDKNTRKLSKMGGGNSYGITLPIGVIRKFGWKERQKLELEIDDKEKQITIKDWDR